MQGCVWLYRFSFFAVASVLLSNTELWDFLEKKTGYGIAGPATTALSLLAVQQHKYQLQVRSNMTLFMTLLHKWDATCIILLLYIVLETYLPPSCKLSDTILLLLYQDKCLYCLILKIRFGRIFKKCRDYKNRIDKAAATVALVNLMSCAG